jgi:Na+-driven multidrug efflux pump
VTATFRQAAAMAAGVMMLLWIICQLAPEPLVGVFSRDPTVIAIGADYLRIISWNFVASGLIFVASSMFQAMGNTVPSLVTSGVRILLVAIPAVVMSRMPGFQLRWLWYLSLVSVYVQLALSMLLLRREFVRRLEFGVAPLMPATAVQVAGDD